MKGLCRLVAAIFVIAAVGGSGCSGARNDKVEEGATPDYHAAFRLAAQAQFRDSVQFHDPHGLKNLGFLHEELVAEFGQQQYQEWLDHAIAEACLVKTNEGWTGAFVFQPHLPAFPSCGAEPSGHFTAEIILGAVWGNVTDLRRPGSEEAVPLSDLVHWLKRRAAVDAWSPGMEVQALVVGGVPLEETWVAADGQTWSVKKLLDLVIARWRENRDKANLKQGDIVPENMLHLAPALIELLQRYPDAIPTYGPVLDEVFDAYRGALHPDGYWGFPGETFSTGHIVEHYVRAQNMGLNIALPSLRPIELMVQHQGKDGWFDIHNVPLVGAQAHGVRALGLTLPLLEAQAATGGQ